MSADYERQLIRIVAAGLHVSGQLDAGFVERAGSTWSNQSYHQRRQVGLLLCAVFNVVQLVPRDLCHFSFDNAAWQFVDT